MLLKSTTTPDIENIGNTTFRVLTTEGVRGSRKSAHSVPTPSKDVDSSTDTARNDTSKIHMRLGQAPTHLRRAIPFDNAAGDWKVPSGVISPRCDREAENVRARIDNCESGCPTQKNTCCALAPHESGGNRNPELPTEKVSAHTSDSAPRSPNTDEFSCAHSVHVKERASSASASEDTALKYIASKNGDRSVSDMNEDDSVKYFSSPTKLVDGEEIAFSHDAPAVTDGTAHTVSSRVPPEGAIHVNSSDHAISLTPEQQCIIDTAQPPRPVGDNSFGKIVRVTAAAGSGKTTVLINLARVLHACGHTNIVYLSFSKASAEDARQRIQNLAGDIKIDARTIHSCAYNLVFEGKPPRNAHVMSDHELQAMCQSICEEEIDAAIKHVLDGDKKQAVRQLSFFIFKTLRQFMLGARDEMMGLCPKEHNTAYYPAVLFHQKAQGRKGIAGELPTLHIHLSGIICKEKE